MLGLPLLALLVTASPDPRLLRAIELYESVEFAKADELLQQLVQDPALAQEDKTRAFKYLAANNFAQGKTAEADAALTSLGKLDRSARLEPTMFDPALIARHEALLKTQPEDKPAVVEPPKEPRPTEAPTEMPTEMVRTRRSPVVPIATIASGAVLQAFGLYTLGSIVARNNEFVAADARGEPAPFERSVAVNDRRMYPIALVSTAAGVLLTGYGIYAFATSGDDAPSVAFGASTDSVALTVSGSF